MTKIDTEAPKYLVVFKPKDRRPNQTPVTCCWTESSGVDSISDKYCQKCRSENDCDIEYRVAKGLPLGTDVFAPPPLGVAPPLPTEACPENTARDAQGNCTPMTQTPEEQSPSPEGPTELSPSVDCAQNPNDPLCETASIPEAGDQGNGGGGEPEGNEEPQPDEESNSNENGNN